MKRFLITLSLSLLLLPTMAQDIYVESNGNNTTISFNSFEKITFKGTTVTILETGGKENSYNMGDIDRIHFGHYQSGISENMQKEAIRHISNEEIEVNGNYGTMLYLYDITGTQLFCTCLKNSSTVISLSQYPKGIYIVKVDEQTYKIVKR